MNLKLKYLNLNQGSNFTVKLNFDFSQMVKLKFNMNQEVQIRFASSSQFCVLGFNVIKHWSSRSPTRKGKPLTTNVTIIQTIFLTYLPKTIKNWFFSWWSWVGTHTAFFANEEHLLVENIKYPKLFHCQIQPDIMSDK